MQTGEPVTSQVCELVVVVPAVSDFPECQSTLPNGKVHPLVN